jgi:hypothetical protein
MRGKFKHKRALITIAILLTLSPIFGILGSELVGYHEPLDVAAEEIGLSESPMWSGVFPDYTIPNLLGDWVSRSIGYIISGIIGVLMILTIGFILRYILGK